MGQWNRHVRVARAITCPLFLLPHSCTAVTMPHVHSTQVGLQWWQLSKSWYPVPEHLSTQRYWRPPKAVLYTLTKVLRTQGRQWGSKKHERPRNLSILAFLIQSLPCISQLLSGNDNTEGKIGQFFLLSALFIQRWAEGRNQGRKCTCQKVKLKLLT